MDYEFHELANIFPAMSEGDFSTLVEQIRKNGQRHPIVLCEGKILDGRHRYRACLQLGITPKFVELGGSDESKLEFVIDNNLAHRHLTESQRAIVGAEIASRKRGGDAGFHKSNTPRGVLDVPTQSEVAERFNVSVNSVQRARKVIDEGASELVEAVKAGTIAVKPAAEIATLPKEEQTKLVFDGEDSMLQAAKEVRQRRAAEKKAQQAELKAVPIVIPDGKYQTIVIDPPWDIAHIDRDTRPNQLAVPYPTMNEQELLDFDLPKMAHENCHLYMWVTHKHLPQALRLAEHWGFRYQCLMTWVKNVGFTPFSWMYSTEHVLFCRRGSLKLLKLGKRLDFSAKVREHSRKPDEFYDLVRECSPGPRIDVFSREKREGFDQFGNEVEKFVEVA